MRGFKMYCTNCGAYISEGSKFCSACGSSVSNYAFGGESEISDDKTIVLSEEELQKTNLQSASREVYGDMQANAEFVPNAEDIGGFREFKPISAQKKSKMPIVVCVMFLLCILVVLVLFFLK